MIVLDTHVLLWAVLEPDRLSAKARSAIRRARRADGIGISSISLWEVASLAASGAVRVAGPIDRWIEQLLDRGGIVVRPITPVIAALSTQTPPDFPRDPADRLIAATARADGSVLVTRDSRIRESQWVRTLW